MNPKPVKVLIIDADAQAAESIRQPLLAQGLFPVEITRAENLAGALQQLKQTRFDVVFLSASLPEGGGLRTIPYVLAHAPHTSVVVFLEPSGEALAAAALQAGAHDVVLRNDCELRTLSRVVRHALERKRYQDELREQREFSRLVSRNATDLIMVLDREGRRVYHSRSYEPILGNLELVRGTTQFDEIDPLDRDPVRRSFLDTLATGQGTRLEYRIRLPDGSTRFIESQADVIKDRWGKPFKMVVLSRDTTERKLVEQALRESEQRFRQLLASTTDYIFTVQVANGKSVATTHSPGVEAITGYKAEDFAEDPNLWLAMVPVPDRPAVLAQVAALLRGETPAPLEHRLIRKDGSLQWIRNTSVPRRDAQGAVVVYDGLITNITERKQAEEQLKRAYSDLRKSEETLRKTLNDLNASHEALKTAQLQLIQAEKFESIGTLAAGVAHEVKNPLQTILMGLAFIGNNLPELDETLRLVLSDMRDAVRRADTIVRELLQLSASTQIVIQPDNFNAMIERSLWLVNYEVNAARIAVHRQLSGDLPLVKMDKSRLEQVFINLFLNAIQAMPQGGSLTVRTRTERWAGSPTRADRTATTLQPGELVVIAEVEDTGVGIPEKNLVRIFDPFFTTKPVGSGSGLGLSVAKQIIDLHGGSIELKNHPPHGVMATVVLRGMEPEPS